MLNIAATAKFVSVRTFNFWDIPAFCQRGYCSRSVRLLVQHACRRDEANSARAGFKAPLTHKNQTVPSLQDE
jgi:hypothetical protein